MYPMHCLRFESGDIGWVSNLGIPYNPFFTRLSLQVSCSRGLIAQLKLGSIAVYIHTATNNYVSIFDPIPRWFQHSIGWEGTEGNLRAMIRSHQRIRLRSLGAFSNSCSMFGTQLLLKLSVKEDNSVTFWSCWRKFSVQFYIYTTGSVPYVITITMAVQPVLNPLLWQYPIYAHRLVFLISVIFEWNILWIL